MNFTENRNLIRWVVVIASFAIISLILWNTYTFFQHFKEEERKKMQNFSLAQKELSKAVDLNTDISDFPLNIVQSNTTTPMVTVDSEGKIEHNNIDPKRAKDSLYLINLVEKF